ncbi:ubiquitinyl hydrolase 1 [Sporothrix epigloea]|uniref:Ubiquitin carboxyl-terminal hydrolase n=1 Tax=Sporothrix epigloea TaxID=1892477 RepID=A0ABP0DKY3_9PEZI
MAAQEATVPAEAPEPYEDDACPDASFSFIPLEANPQLMTSLLHRLGVDPAVAVHDVFSLTEPDMLAFVPRPAMGLLLVFPMSDAYEQHRLAEDADRDLYLGKGSSEPVMWFRQTIKNACGLMGLLHATANGPARNFVGEGTPLDALLKQAVDLDPRSRAKLLETNEALAAAHLAAAEQGDTTAPDALDKIDLHYVCFVRTDDGTLWELDGRRKGPLARGRLGPDEDVLSEKALEWGPLAFLARESADLRFSCVALGPSTE